MYACVPGSVTTTGGSDSSALASSTNCPRPPVRSVRWESACHRMHGRAYASPARRIGGQFGGCKLNLMRRRRVGFDAELVRLLDLPPQCGPPGWLTAMASWGRTRAMRESACTLSVPPTLSHTARGCLMDGRTDGGNLPVRTFGPETPSDGSRAREVDRYVCFLFYFFLFYFFFLFFFLLFFSFFLCFFFFPPDRCC